MILQSNFYFKFLLGHLTKVSNLTFETKNEYWINEYEGLKENLIIENLPKILPLIYPDFLYSSSGQFIGDAINYNFSGFNSGINLSDNCQYNNIHENGSCEFNNFRSIRGKCQADHYWPHSLGGPSIIQNRILLCKFHNVAKSNSVLNDFWTIYPSWLNDYLTRMYNIKN